MKCSHRSGIVYLVSNIHRNVLNLKAENTGKPYRLVSPRGAGIAKYAVSNVSILFRFFHRNFMTKVLPVIYMVPGYPTTHEKFLRKTNLTLWTLEPSPIDILELISFVCG